MPTMPTFDVDDDQAARILAAYKAKFGTTTDQETIEAFRKRQQEMVVNDVLTFEAERAREEAEIKIAADMDALRQTLPGAPPPPTAEEVARQELIAAQVASINQGAAT